MYNIKVKKNFYKNVLLKKIELNFYKNYLSFYSFSYLNLFIFNKKFIKKKKLLNIYLCDIISLLRGWRHLLGLPVRGQRTWSNANTVFSNNLILRNYKFLLIKKKYNNISFTNFKEFFLFEQIKLL